MTIHAIETRYAGCRFRSRLESRWAVFFDTLGIKWEYEPQGFENRMFCTCRLNGNEFESWGGVDQCDGARCRYLPDFYLPELQAWVEVKGSESECRAHMQLYAEMIDWGGQLPHVADSDGTTRGLLILGPIPDVDRYDVTPLHTILQHHKNVWRNFARFVGRGERFVHFGVNDLVLSSSSLEVVYTGREGYCDATWGDALTDGYFDPCGISFTEPIWLEDTPRINGELRAAYTAARAARFEFGESGAR